ncbi:hypothetical protein AMTRI_Chr02g265030 [Amborella trichopoda]|uniref:Uncharacterized protein n=1 Tax=Amborella trichopoda TaxID=13333 RepID=U5D450_AMBTC|nr:hypothetical protein AMTR_s00057p00214780 [Amborella trichopoda]
MDVRLILCVLATATSTFFASEVWRKRREGAHRLNIAKKKLKLICEAIAQADERYQRCSERHDRILNQVTSHFFCSRELEEALAGARATMTEALEFSAGLQDTQARVISSFLELL